MSKRFICSITVNPDGSVMDADEKAFLKEAMPLGVILFKQNCKDKKQLRALTDSVREILGENALILVDQEGGRIQRLKPPVWKRHPSARTYIENAPWVSSTPTKSYHPPSETVLLNIMNGAKEIALELKEVGINVDCFPVLDVPIEGASDIIGNRSYSHDVAQVSILGRAAALGLKQAGVLPVVKHMPGHGRAMVDSHHELPTVTTSLDVLKITDFLPFVFNADMPFGMVAHIIFEDIDPNNPATQSNKVIKEVIREYIGFRGLLMTDDITMEALKGTAGERAKKCIDAGIDIVLLCNDTLQQAEDVANNVPDATFEVTDIDNLLRG